MTELRQMTVAELAEDAFLKQEVLQAHMMMNTPTDFEERKKAFVRLAMAREAANKAQAALRADYVAIDRTIAIHRERWFSPRAGVLLCACAFMLVIIGLIGAIWFYQVTV